MADHSEGVYSWFLSWRSRILVNKHSAACYKWSSLNLSVAEVVWKAGKTVKERRKCLFMQQSHIENLGNIINSWFVYQSAKETSRNLTEECRESWRVWEQGRLRQQRNLHATLHFTALACMMHKLNHPFHPLHRHDSVLPLWMMLSKLSVYHLLLQCSYIPLCTAFSNTLDLSVWHNFFHLSNFHIEYEGLPQLLSILRFIKFIKSQ